MLVFPLISVFIDASSLLVAARSPHGGSSVILHLSGELVSAVVSAPVLLEAERNIHAKLPPDAWERWQYILLTTPLVVVDVPPSAQRYADLVSAKDAHVYAAALGARVPYLVTLDQRLARRVNALASSVQALSPGEFIRGVLRRH